MLTALENGVRGGKWHSLIDKVYSQANLLAAFRRVEANGGAAGVDHVTVKAFGSRLEENLAHLHTALKQESYVPQAVRRVHIKKPGGGLRPLGIPTVRDRVVQAALKQVLEPIFERDFAEHSYGFRPGRGCKDALRRVAALLKEGYRYVVDADLKSYFDTIDHDRLLALVAARVSDRRVQSLVGAFLRQGVMEDLATYTPQMGTPQGAVISPLLSNIYLDGLDHTMAESGFEMVRYADDFVILCQGEEQAHAALALVTEWVGQARLALHPDKTRVVHESEGFDFLGYRFKRGRRRPRRKSLEALKDKIRERSKRTHGHSLDCIIADLNRIVRGWYGYYKHSHPITFIRLDGWIRMRLRSILRRRSGRAGPGRGFDHRRWPNAYFASHGLFSLKTAYELDRQSSSR